MKIGKTQFLLLAALLGDCLPACLPVCMGNGPKSIKISLQLMGWFHLSKLKWLPCVRNSTDPIDASV